MEWWFLVGNSSAFISGVNLAVVQPQVLHLVLVGKKLDIYVFVYLLFSDKVWLYNLSWPWAWLPPECWNHRWHQPGPCLSQCGGLLFCACFAFSDTPLPTLWQPGKHWTTFMSECMIYPLKNCPNASGCHAKKPEGGECLSKRRNAFKRKQKQTKKLFVYPGFLIFQFRDRSNPLNKGPMYRTKHRAGESWEESGQGVLKWHGRWVSEGQSRPLFLLRDLWGRVLGGTCMTRP